MLVPIKISSFGELFGFGGLIWSKKYKGQEY